MIRNYVIGTIVLIIIDTIWLLAVMNKSFSNMVYNIQGQPMSLNIPYALIVYILLGIGVTYFGINRVDKDAPLMSSLINGGLFGLICYGVFDFTNMTIFKNYDTTTALLDTAWGGILCTLTTYISYKIINLIDESY